jgi:hypothetical protein
MRVRLLHPLGQHHVGALVDYRPSEAGYLVRSGNAEYADEPAAQAAGSEPASDAVETTDSVAAVDGSSQSEGPSGAELKARATELGVATYGTKAQIAERITEAEARSQAG